MANPSKQKGTAAESAVVAWMRDHGAPAAERRALAGNRDLGDITGLGPGICVEVKACRDMSLAAWVDEVQVEAANADADVPVVIHKRRGRGDVGEWYFTMRVADGWDLLRQAGWIGEAE